MFGNKRHKELVQCIESNTVTLAVTIAQLEKRVIYLESLILKGFTNLNLKPDAIIPAKPEDDKLFKLGRSYNDYLIIGTGKTVTGGDYYEIMDNRNKSTEFDLLDTNELAKLIQARHEEDTKIQLALNKVAIQEQLEEEGLI